VTNRGARELPFGIGFHPWFDRTPDARLEIAAASAFEMDERQMPVRAIPFETVSGGGTSFNISERMPFDTPLAGWSGRAAIHWPSRRTRLSIEATPALGLAHIFAPVTPEVFCVEPVSHMPDVVNRRHLAVHGDMTTLAPGETLAGSMTLRAEAFSG
jgi:aldose 1-epimerase